MIVHESLNGGVVQTRHPTLLKAGEIQRGDEMILRPGDPRLHRAPGRSSYGTVRSTGISTTTNGTTTLTSAAAFGTDIATVTVTAGSPFITKASAFGAVVEGQTVVGTGIPAGTVVRRVIGSSDVELSKNATATGTPTVTFSDLHPGTFISGTGITTGTYIASIESASSLTMSAAASDSTTTSRTFSEAVTGLSALGFNSVEDYLLLAKAADKIYYSGLTGLTGTFTALLVGMSQNAEAILRTIRYNNRHVIITGFDTARLLYYKNNAVSSRTLGMQPVKDFTGVAIVSGSWPSLPTFQEGYYYFLVTEVFNPGEDDEVESTYSGDPKVVRITDYTTQGVKITFTAATGGTTDRYNNGLYGMNAATHRKVYMSPRQDAEFPVADLSTFRAVSEPVPISTTEITLTNENPHQRAWAKTLATYGGYDALFPGGPTGALASVAAQTASATFTANSNVLTSSAAFGTVVAGMVITSTNNRIPYGTTVVSVTSTSSLVMSNPATSAGTETVGFGNKPSFDNVLAAVPPNAGNFRAGAFQDFGIQNIGGFSTGTITGIKVRIKGSWFAFSGADRGFYVSINKGATESTLKWATFTQAKLQQGYIELGSQFDTWGVSWSPSDFVDGAANINVLLRKHSAAVDVLHTIDGVEITVYAGGNTINLDGDPFKTIILSDQLGNSFGVGSAGAPPIPSTGDMVLGQMVLDDTATGTDIVASLPDDIDAYPDAYRLPLQDRVKVILSYGRGGVIGCENSVKRLNYFPNESDADFRRGKAFEDITTDHGMVGPQSAVKVDLPGRGTVIVYQSHNGLHVTDAVTSTTLNEDLDWTGSSTGTPVIEPTLIQRSILVNYPKLYLLGLYYVPYGGTRRTKVIYFSYHPTHMKDGLKMPAIGPVSCQGGSATSFLLTGIPRLMTGHGTDGKVYVEDTGTTDENGVAVAPTIRTRRFFAAAPGMEGRIERIFVIADAAGDATTGAFSALSYRQNQAEALTLANTTPGSTLVGGLIEIWNDVSVETFEIEFTKTTAQTAAFGLHYLFFRDSRSADDVNN